MKHISVVLLKFEESSQKFMFRPHLVHKRVPDGFAAVINCNEISKIGHKVQLKLALRANLLKHPLRNYGFEECVMLFLEVLQKINQPIHQVVIAELVGQDKGR